MAVIFQSSAQATHGQTQAVGIGMKVQYSKKGTERGQQSSFGAALKTAESQKTIDFIGILKWWQEPELNRRHKDFQFFA
jgi:hypothetical protein